MMGQQCKVLHTKFQPSYIPSAASIPTDDLVPPNRHTRNHQSLASQTPLAGTDIYKSNFFPQTLRDWNSLTDSLISASESVEDSVTTFTSQNQNQNCLLVCAPARV